MSEQYVPTTDEVRRFFVNGKSEEEYAASWIDRYASEFDRWLAAHDRKVKAEALREAATVAHSYGSLHGERGGDWFPSEWAGQVAGWLERRADRIESQETP